MIHIGSCFHFSSILSVSLNRWRSVRLKKDGLEKLAWLLKMYATRFFWGSLMEAHQKAEQVSLCSQHEDGKCILEAEAVSLFILAISQILLTAEEVLITFRLCKCLQNWQSMASRLSHTKLLNSRLAQFETFRFRKSVLSVIQSFRSFLTTSSQLRSRSILWSTCHHQTHLLTKISLHGRFDNLSGKPSFNQTCVPLLSTESVQSLSSQAERRKTLIINALERWKFHFHTPSIHALHSQLILHYIRRTLSKSLRRWRPYAARSRSLSILACRQQRSLLIRFWHRWDISRLVRARDKLRMEMIQHEHQKRTLRYMFNHWRVEKLEEERYSSISPYRVFMALRYTLSSDHLFIHKNKKCSFN